MKGRNLWLSLFALLALGAVAPAPAGLAPGIDQPSIGLPALGDLWHLCFWHDGLRAGMSSSHSDRDLNIDLMNFHGLYRGNPVLARLEGPGVIYRVWSAAPTGALLFYPDGARQPLACGFLEYLEGDCLAEAAFAVGRYANYTPIPFRKSMIVTARGFRLEGAYYHVSYMTYQDKQGIETIADDWAKTQKAERAAAENFWTSAGSRPARDPGGITELKVETLALPPGGRAELALPGAGLVTELKIADASDPLDPLADLGLRVFFDGAAEPAVDSPVDAFFGNRFDPRAKSKGGAYQTLVASATASGYSTRWPIPFSGGMRLALDNPGLVARRVRVEIAFRRLDSLPPSALRFHARYREQDYPDLLSRDQVHGLFYRVDQKKNYLVLERSGRGYYAGCFLFVRSLGNDWWGEGDEMIWVDGAEPARIRGTGTEDEFNWSYGFRENRSPVSGALLAASRNRKVPLSAVGENVLYRFRPTDFVPFAQSIKVTYERLGSTTNWIKRYPGSPVNVSSERGDDYRSVAFWYERP